MSLIPMINGGARTNFRTVKTFVGMVNVIRTLNSCLNIASKSVVPVLVLEEDKYLLKKAFVLTMDLEEESHALLQSAKQETLTTLKIARLHAMSALKSQLTQRYRWPLEKIKMTKSETTHQDAFGNSMLKIPKRISIPMEEPHCG